MRHSGSVATVGTVEVDTLEEFDQLVRTGTSMAGWFLQGLDLRERAADLLRRDPRGAVFLGCALEGQVEETLRQRGAVIFPELPGLPFEPYRARLYTAEELYGDVRGAHSYRRSFDARSYAWRLAQNTPPDVDATLAMSLHDHAIGDALADQLSRLDGVVGVMGGHGVERGTAAYEEAARLGLALTQSGKTVLTGGGPGAMEAVNLGARMAAAPDRLDEVLAELATVPSFRPSVDAWAKVALDIRRRFPDGGGYGIPTWFYGHEPPNVFAAEIAKFFSNAIREDTLLRWCAGGVLYLPGAAGTVQEIFQSSTPAYYAPEGARIPPLVLVGREYWTTTLPAWPLVSALAEGRGMARAVHCVETWPEALPLLAPPRRR